MGLFVDRLIALTPDIWWPLTDTSGTTAADAAGSNDGTYTTTAVFGGSPGTGPTLGEPSIGGSDGSVRFDGSRATRIEGALAASHATFSSIMLVRFHGWAPENAAFGDHINSLLQIDAESNWMLRVRGDGTPAHNVTEGDAAGGSVTSTPPTIDTLDQTYLVVLTWDGSTRRLYLGCDEIGSSSGSGSVNSGTIRVDWEFGDDRSSNAWMSDVAFFYRALTPTEVCDLADAIGEPSPPPVGGWPDSIGISVDVTGDPVSDGTAPDWTDITDYVNAWSTQRGRSFELDRVETGTASADLINTDSRFDPTNTGSPYSPSLLPMRPFRISIGWDSVIYYPFTGYTERWPQSYDDHGLKGWTKLTAVDSSYALSQITLRSVLYKEITDTTLLSYFPMDETSGRKVHDVWGSQGPFTRDRNGAGRYSFGDSFLPGTTGGGVNFTSQKNASSKGVRLHNTVGIAGIDPVAGGGTFLGIWVQCDDDAFSTTIFLQEAIDGSDRARIQIGIDSSGHAFAATVADAGGTDVASVVGPVITDDDLHLLLMTIGTAGKQIELFVDNTSAGTDATSAALATGFPTADWYLADDATSTSYYTGQMAHLFVGVGPITSGQRTQIYEGGTTVYTEFEGMSGRLNRLMTLPEPDVDLPTDYDSGTTLLGPADRVNGLNALEAFQQTAEQDGNVFYVTGDGTLRARARDWDIAPTPLYTFGEDVAGGEIPYEGDVEFDFDDTYIKNEVTVTNSDGQTERRVDGTSQGLYWPRTDEFDVNYAHETEVADTADRIIELYKDPHLRPSVVTIKPSKVGNTAAAAWPACLGLDIGDCVTVVRRPPSGVTISVDAVILSIEHSVSMPKDWETKFTLAPALTRA